ncbi:chorismate mutase [Francisella philomiragia]|uniref:chorismate mutase n=1 Tax=Francisella philomiragia TaxID=28110 RepID=A0A0B6D3L9_9GAMM|nr:chorismate mutase [Francisella philomiragia]AJI53426.1 chorismate mutase type II family protein [Francisella philomiragia]MBY7733668.1 chorismate mutase [Francisella philomiragia]
MKKYILILLSLAAFSLSFAMSPSSFVAKPTSGKYESEIMDADEQIIKFIAKRQELRNQMLDLQKNQKLPSNDPFEDKDLAATRTNFAIQYNVSPKLVDQVFDVLNSSAQKPAK